MIMGSCNLFGLTGQSIQSMAGIRFQSISRQRLSCPVCQNHAVPLLTSLSRPSAQFVGDVCYIGASWTTRCHHSSVVGGNKKNVRLLVRAAFRNLSVDVTTKWHNPQGRLRTIQKIKSQQWHKHINHDLAAIKTIMRYLFTHRKKTSAVRLGW